MVPLYILGLLKRYGPQHGYRIKKTIADMLSDFTHIKLPTIYYHLSKMAADGLLSAISEKPGARPEKTVYSLTDKGAAACRRLLSELLAAEYRPAFDNDAIFYFAEHFRPAELAAYLQSYAGKLGPMLDIINAHREETLRHVPDDAKPMVHILFRHHELHFQAELAWARDALRMLQK
ncbi:MAG: PadR family transcriptional regulator [Clostridiales bacterium]|nr:PadR family transcriptional regulator [Clostridiales bacterium]